MYQGHIITKDRITINFEIFGLYAEKYNENLRLILLIELINEEHMNYSYLNLLGREVNKIPFYISSGKFSQGKKGILQPFYGMATRTSTRVFTNGIESEIYKKFLKDITDTYNFEKATRIELNNNINDHIELNNNINDHIELFIKDKFDHEHNFINYHESIKNSAMWIIKCDSYLNDMTISENKSIRNILLTWDYVEDAIKLLLYRRKVVYAGRSNIFYEILTNSDEYFQDGQKDHEKLYSFLNKMDFLKIMNLLQNELLRERLRQRISQYDVRKDVIDGVSYILKTYEQGFVPEVIDGKKITNSIDGLTIIIFDIIVECKIRSYQEYLENKLAQLEVNLKKSQEQFTINGETKICTDLYKYISNNLSGIFQIDSENQKVIITYDESYVDELSPPILNDKQINDIIGENNIYGFNINDSYQTVINRDSLNEIVEYIKNFSKLLENKYKTSNEANQRFIQNKIKDFYEGQSLLEEGNFPSLQDIYAYLLLNL